MSKINKIIAQSCTSKKCKEMFKKDITSKCEAITTPQEFDIENKKFICLYCGAIYKF